MNYEKCNPKTSFRMNLIFALLLLLVFASVSLILPDKARAQGALWSPENYGNPNIFTPQSAKRLDFVNGPGRLSVANWTVIKFNKVTNHAPTDSELMIHSKGIELVPKPMGYTDKC